jgi:hypothetical protein
VLILLAFGARNHVFDDEGTAVPPTMDMTAAVRGVRTQTMTVRGALLYT